MTPILTTADLAARWHCSTKNVTSRWRRGLIPAPFNADQSKGHLWHIDVIEAHERGTREGSAA